MIRDEKRQKSLLDEVHDWVRTVAHPNEGRVAEADEVPAGIVEDMRARGFFGWSIPEEFGGLGLTTEELAQAAMELSQCAVAYRARVGTNTGIGSEALVADGTEEQKRRFLPELASGRATGCFALSEPTAGSDATAVETTALRDGEDYVLDGMKCYITNAPIADLFTVIARTDPGLTALEAATLGVAGYSSALAVDRLEMLGMVPARGPMLVSGATGGVGSLAVAMLVRRGFAVVALSSKPDARFLTGLGAQQVIALPGPRAWRWRHGAAQGLWDDDAPLKAQVFRRSLRLLHQGLDREPGRRADIGVECQNVVNTTAANDCSPHASDLL